MTHLCSSYPDTFLGKQMSTERSEAIDFIEEH